MELLVWFFGIRLVTFHTVFHLAKLETIRWHQDRFDWTVSQRLLSFSPFFLVSYWPNLQSNMVPFYAPRYLYVLSIGYTLLDSPHCCVFPILHQLCKLCAICQLGHCLENANRPYVLSFPSRLYCIVERGKHNPCPELLGDMRKENFDRVWWLY